MSTAYAAGAAFGYNHPVAPMSGPYPGEPYPSGWLAAALPGGAGPSAYPFNSPADQQLLSQRSIPAMSGMRASRMLGANARAMKKKN